MNGPVNSLRHVIYSHGFRPVPVLKGDKAPLGKQWTEAARKDPPFCLDNEVEHAPNTGILGDGLRAADFDINDVEVIKQVVGLAFDMLGITMMRWRDNSPRCLLLYAAAEGEPGKLAITGTAGKVEILGKGQQFVAFGHHPTGAEWQWHRGSPLTHHRDNLTVVTEAQVRAFLEACAPLIGAEPPKPPPQPKRAQSNGRAAQQGDFFATVNREALANLGAWVPVLCPAAKPQGTGAWRVSSADRGRPDLEEDISFHPDGIRDFGLEEGLTPIDAVMEHGGAPDAKAAAFWLCEQMGQDPGAWGWRKDGVGANGDGDRPIQLDALPGHWIELVTHGTQDGDAPASNHRALMKMLRWLKTHDFQLDAVLTLLQAHPNGIAKGYGGGRLEPALTKIWDKLRDLTRPATWVDQLHGAARGKPTNDLANVVKALRLAPELAGCFGYDELARRSVVLQPIPGTTACGHPVQDADLFHLQHWLQEATLRKLGKEAVHDAVELVARDNRFHPVRDYLDNLVWDGVKRLDRWLTYYLGVERLTRGDSGTDYVDRIGAMFMISAVARIYQPGCQCDYVLVLEGPQGNLKSSAVRVLASPWFSDHLPDLHKNEKDVSQHLNGKWIIEIPELSALVKADTTAIKSFITRRREQYRRSYGRLDVDEPRQCVFIGTTNESTYLRDGTGGRRFWPVMVVAIALEALTQDRENLWAEAVHRYRTGERWWPDAAFERETLQPQQDARFEEDAWTDPIRTFLLTVGRTTIQEIANRALSLETARLGTREQRRISNILAALAWHHGPRTGTGRWWLPPVTQ